MGNLATAISNQGRKAEAEKLYHEVLEIQRRVLGPAHEVTLLTIGNLARFYERQGIAYAEQKELEKAAQCFQKALAIDPKDATAHLNLGATFERMGKLDEAAVSFREATAVELNPLGSKSLNQVGLFFVRKGELDEAITCFEKIDWDRPRLCPALLQPRRNLPHARAAGRGHRFLREGRQDRSPESRHP